MLIFISVGDTSIHINNNWNEKFDLWVHYFGDNDSIYETYKLNSTYITRGKGLKFENIVTSFNQYDFWKKYDYIWFPDDDIKIDINDTFLFYELSKLSNSDISQPSLYNMNVSHYKLINKPNMISEWVDFIEIQMPLFKTKIFDNTILPFLTANVWNRSGFGFDFWWSDQWVSSLKFKKLLVHQIQAIHTRPLSLNYNKYNIKPYEDFDKMKNIVNKTYLNYE